MIHPEMNDEQFKDYAIGILQRELGAAGLARFLRLYRSGSGDYTKDRERWLGNVSLSDLLDEIRT